MNQSNESGWFNIGDRVIGRGEMSGLNITGMTGTIVPNRSTIYAYAVNFDDEVKGKFHDCYGEAEAFHGYFCNAGVLERLDERKYDGLISDLSGLLS
jgi:hypothetical protein